MSRMQKKARMAARHEALEIAGRLAGLDCLCKSCLRLWQDTERMVKHDDVPHVYDANCGCDYCSSPF